MAEYDPKIANAKTAAEAIDNVLAVILSAAVVKVSEAIKVPLDQSIAISIMILIKISISRIRNRLKHKDKL